jgi:regulator of extracellular matrix RemA (YlzA/DUF370 family)
MFLTEFEGCWILIRNENFDEFLSSIGVNWMKRKLILRESLENEIKIHPSAIEITSSGINPFHHVFPLNETIVSDVGDTMTILDEELRCITHIVSASVGEVKFSRYINSSDEMVLECVHSETIARRIFVKK